MTALNTTRRFFELYRSHDIDGMVALFADDGVIDYIPVALTGPATRAGRQIWTGLIDGFPNLTNEIAAAYVSDDGRTMIAEVTISGTQAKDAFGIENKGRTFSLPHVFIVTVDERNRITSMKAYWDNAAWFTALGKTALV